MEIGRSQRLSIYRSLCDNGHFVWYIYGVFNYRNTNYCMKQVHIKLIGGAFGDDEDQSLLLDISGSRISLIAILMKAYMKSPEILDIITQSVEHYKELTKEHPGTKTCEDKCDHHS